MSTTSSRTLRLLSLLQTRRYWSGAELAEQLDVSHRTLRRDIDRLRALGYPVDAQRGVDGGYQLAAGAVLPPLVLDDEEAVAIGVGLQAGIQGGTVTGIEESSVRALTKIVQVMPARLRRRIDALASITVPGTWTDASPSVDVGDLTSIAQTCRDAERLEFTYTARDDERTVRLVDPHRLVLLGRRWYLVAWDLSRIDWRTFRLDRLTDPHGTGAHFPPREPPGGDAADFVRAAIGNISTRHHVEAIVHVRADDVRSTIGRWGTVEEIDDERCLLRMVADSLEWPMMALGSTGKEFEIVGPPAMVEYARDWVDRFTRGIGGTPPVHASPGVTDARSSTEP
jgi:predicted DNA-binding transcriptional regulator YafY